MFCEFKSLVEGGQVGTWKSFQAEIQFETAKRHFKLVLKPGVIISDSLSVLVISEISSRKFSLKMNSLIIFVFLAASFGGNQMKELKCESEGCYEVIKVFAELLEQKISASDAVSMIIN